MAALDAPEIPGVPAELDFGPTTMERHPTVQYDHQHRPVKNIYNEPHWAMKLLTENSSLSIEMTTNQE